MFNEDDDWSDGQDAQTLGKSVHKNIRKANNDANVKPKVVGKKSLMRTLQTLGSIPEWKSNDHQQDSDSDSDRKTAATPSSSKKKKKRRKKRKNPGTSEEQQENRDLNQTVKEEKPVAKKRNKVGTRGPKVESTSAGEKKDEEMIKSAKTNTNNAANTEKLSRQQWKNKMRNKRKCKNKYRTEEGNEPKSVSEAKPKDELKTGSSCNDNSKGNTKRVAQKKKNEKEHKPQKRKRIEVDGDVSCAADKKQLNETEVGCDDAMVTADQQPLLAKGLKPQLSKEQSLKREKLRKILHSTETDQQESPSEQRDEPVVPEAQVIQDCSASLRSRMEQRLESGRFRYINEVLYSTSSSEAKRMFTRDPEAFWIYHKGYTAQVQRWPTNPVEIIISYIQQKPSSLVVADFGCGDCKIARSVKNKVHSFDLAATCELVTVCDMANVPLADGSVDIAVFCLSLMGTNLADFLAEANRVLKMRGVLKIAEVASRFDNVRNFITALANLGFKMVSKDTENTHFYSFEFVKTGDAPENVKKFGLELKPCVYKKR